MKGLPLAAAASAWVVEGVALPERVGREEPVGWHEGARGVCRIVRAGAFLAVREPVRIVPGRARAIHADIPEDLVFYFIFLIELKA